MTITSLTLGRSVEYDLLEQRGVCSVGRNPRLAEFKPTGHKDEFVRQNATARIVHIPSRFYTSRQSPVSAIEI